MFSLGIDARMVRHTGIGTYVKGLVKGLTQSGGFEREKACLYGDPGALADYKAFSHRRFSAPIYSFQEQCFYPLHTRKVKLWHAPHYNIPLLKGKAKLVVTIHDIIHWIFRKDFFSPIQAFYAGNMLRAAITQSDHVITVSEQTRRDLVQHFDAPPEKISVIYEGVSEHFEPAKDRESIAAAKKKYGIPGDYFLYVGLLKPHKNILWLIRLFRELKKEGRSSATLVLVGKKDRKYSEEYRELGQLESGNGIIHVPYVESAELAPLYSGALALVHPSLYEGFGLTLLEAMACGTPVIACRAGSVPEVAGEAACLVEACAPREMTEAIVRMEKAPELREEYRRKGFQQAARFRWENTGRETLNVYERVLSES